MMDQEQGCFNTQAGVAVQKEMTLYEEHEFAVREYHSSCHDYQFALTRKRDANAKLQKISQVLAQAIAASLDDPTQPKTEQPAGNGHATIAIGGAATPAHANLLNRTF